MTGRLLVPAAAAALALLLVLGALVTGAPVAAAATGGPACVDPQSKRPPAPADGQALGTRQPVVLVHGWNGAPLDDTATRLDGNTSIASYEFNYSKYAAYWANSDHIAPCVADYVNAVSAAAGDRPVILVAHSMGGLAIRYAFMPKYAAHPLTATEVPAVITLGTPYTGSPFGGTGLALALEAEGAAGLKSTVAAVFSGTLPHLFTRTLAPVVAAGDGGTCLAGHTGAQALAGTACGDLPAWLPHGVDLTTIGGEITVDRNLFGTSLYALPLNSDGIVDATSANGYVFGGPGHRPPTGQAHISGALTDACTTDTDALYAALTTVAGAQMHTSMLAVDNATLNDVGTGHLSASGALVSGLSLTARCSHLHITSDAFATSQVARAIYAAMQNIKANSTQAGPSPTPASDGSSGAPPAGATQQIVLRPVTAAGYPADGWGLSQPSDAIDCANAHPAEAAVDPGITTCRTTTASQPEDCWAGAGASLLCLYTPFDRLLVSYPNAVRPAGAAPPATPWPTALVLDSGERCQRKPPMAGPELLGDPGWSSTYLCQGADVVWAGPADHTPGVDEHSAAWTVQAGPPSGPLSTHKVTTAYFVGAAAG